VTVAGGVQLPLHTAGVMPPCPPPQEFISNASVAVATDNANALARDCLGPFADGGCAHFFAPAAGASAVTCFNKGFG